MRNIGYYVGFGMAGYAAAWLPLAYYIDHTLLPGQMLAEYGTSKVMPAVADFFIWADIFWLPWICGYIVAKESRQWRGNQPLPSARYGVVVLMALIAFGLTIIFHKFMILSGEWPATLGSHLGLTTAGWLHILYMTAALAIIGLHFFCSKSEPVTVAVVALALLVQIGLDLHVPMHFAQKLLHYPWYPDVLANDPKQIWMIIGGSLTVLVLSAIKLLPR